MKAAALPGQAAIGHNPILVLPHARTRARQGKIAYENSWRSLDSTYFTVIVLMSGVAGRQIVQFVTHDFDGLRGRSDAVIARNFRALVKAEGHYKLTAIHIVRKK